MTEREIIQTLVRVYQDPTPIILQAGREKLQDPKWEIIMEALGSSPCPSTPVVNRGFSGYPKLQLTHSDLFPPK